MDDVRCPAWCVTSADEHATDDPGARVHEGPRFGLLRTWWVEGTDDYTASLDTESQAEGLARDLDADDLRHLAADALDAALWIDRQVAAGPRALGRSVVDLVREAHERATRSA